MRGAERDNLPLLSSGLEWRWERCTRRLKQQFKAEKVTQAGFPSPDAEELRTATGEYLASTVQGGDERPRTQMQLQSESGTELRSQNTTFGSFLLISPPNFSCAHDYPKRSAPIPSGEQCRCYCAAQPRLKVLRWEDSARIQPPSYLRKSSFPPKLCFSSRQRQSCWLSHHPRG